MMATAHYLPQAFDTPKLVGPLSTDWDIHITGLLPPSASPSPHC